MSKISDLFRERNQQVDRANDAESRGFFGTAATARDRAADLDRRIGEAEAEDAGGSWPNWLHP